MSHEPRPQVVHLADVPVVPAEQAVTGVPIARLITRRRCGSNLMLGACWMQPGEQSYVWSAREQDDDGDGDVRHNYGRVDETYYIVRGRLRLAWDDGELDLGPDDAVYLAPGWTYQLTNVGDEPSFFVYGMAPTPE